MVVHFTLTCYKVQGDTLCDGVVVAFWKSPIQFDSNGRRKRAPPIKPQYAYMVCSQIQSIDKLFIFHDPDDETAKKFHRLDSAKKDAN